MATSSGGSFIPKRSTGKVTPKRSGRRIYILSYITYVLFFGTLLSVVGVFVFNQQATKQLESLVTEVSAARASFNTSQIDTIRALDTRINTAEQILNWHLAPSRIFDSLESTILQSVQLDQFSYTRETGMVPVLSFGGLTENFDALLFQRNVIESSATLASARIESVSYGVAGEEVSGTQVRSGTPVQSAAGKTTVIFTFEDEDAIDGIRYLVDVPRAPVVETVTENSEDTLTETETEIDGSDAGTDTESVESNSGNE